MGQQVIREEGGAADINGAERVSEGRKKEAENKVLGVRIRC